jgi:hypothetical protein
MGRRASRGRDHRSLEKGSVSEPDPRYHPNRDRFPRARHGLRRRCLARAARPLPVIDALVGQPLPRHVVRLAPGDGRARPRRADRSSSQSGADRLGPPWRRGPQCPWRRPVGQQGPRAGRPGRTPSAAWPSAWAGRPAGRHIAGGCRPANKRSRCRPDSAASSRSAGAGRDNPWGPWVLPSGSGDSSRVADEV